MSERADLFVQRALTLAGAGLLLAMAMWPMRAEEWAALGIFSATPAMIAAALIVGGRRQAG